MEKYNGMKQACKIASTILDEVVNYSQINRSKNDINLFCKSRLNHYEATSACYGYDGTYPGYCCISINHELCHGVPSDYIIQKGDIVSIDVCLKYGEYYGDTCGSFVAGNGNAHLVISAWKIIHKVIQKIKPGIQIGTIGYWIKKYTNQAGYHVSEYFCGHFIGKKLHLPPDVPFSGKKNTGYTLKEGDCFTIEPIIITAPEMIEISQDGWTAYQKNKKLSAQFEHTIYVTKSGYEILTSNTTFDTNQQFIM